MSHKLYQHGAIWAEFDLMPGPFGKTLTLIMRRAGETSYRSILTITAIGNQLLYTSEGNVPVLPQTAAGTETEHDDRKD